MKPVAACKRVIKEPCIERFVIIRDIICVYIIALLLFQSQLRTIKRIKFLNNCPVFFKRFFRWIYREITPGYLCVSYPVFLGIPKIIMERQRA